MATRWDHARAILICAHLALITIAAIPTPSGDLNPRHKRDPDVRASLSLWSDLLVRLRVVDDTDEAIDWLFDRGSEMVSARRAVLGRGRRYLVLTGNEQSWRMFGIAPVVHGRLQVHGRADGGDWVALYDERVGPGWGSMVLDQSRVRSLRSTFGSQGKRARYNLFARWIAERALADHPRVDAVRVQYQTVLIPRPEVLRERGSLIEKEPYWTLVTHRRGIP